MNRDVILTNTSLLSILLFTFHMSDDIVRGFEPGGIKNVIGVLMMVVWLYGTLVLAGRRAGYIIMLLGSILGSAVPVVHMIGSGLVGPKIDTNGVFFWVWTLIALQVAAIFSLILSVLGLFGLLRANSKNQNGKPEAEAGQ